MSMFRLTCAGATIALCATAVIASGAPPSIPSHNYGLGQPATQAEIQGWNIDVEPDGANLPPGRGTVAAGADLYATACASCHGATGQGGIGPRLVGGIGTLATAHPVKTVGSYWPFATTVFDYIRRAMPFNHPELLSNDQVYALVDYILFLNSIVPKAAVMDAATLPEVKMPNRDGFLWHDQGPDVHATACMANCK